MLKLPNVSLVLIETMEHALGRLALQECLDKAKFGQVLVFSDEPHEFDMDGVDERHEVENWPEKIGWSRFAWQEVAPFLRTSHVLFIQWDSWIVNPEIWRDEFLQCDYVGAPWWHKTMNVGNGGFSMRSTALMRYLRKHRNRFPCINAVDDDMLCRKYRPALEDEGFVWATEAVAADFAFECVQPPEGHKTWGMHAAFNFGKVLNHDKLMERARLMASSKYITTSTHIWKGFSEKNPEVIEQLKAEGILNGEGVLAENVWIKK